MQQKKNCEEQQNMSASSWNIVEQYSNIGNRIDYKTCKVDSLLVL